MTTITFEEWKKQKFTGKNSYDDLLKELWVEIEAWREQRNSLAKENVKLRELGNKMGTAISFLMDGIGCGCGGDNGLCGTCREFNGKAEKILDSWFKAGEK